MEKIEIGKMILDTAHAIKHGINTSLCGDCIDISGYQMRVLGFGKKHSLHGEMIFQKVIEREFKIKGSSVTIPTNYRAFITMENKKNKLTEKVTFDEMDTSEDPGFIF